MLLSSSDSLFMNNRQKFLFGLFFATMLPSLLAKECTLKKLTYSKLYGAISSMSRYSYTLYLVHFPILICCFILTNKLTQGDFFLCLLVTLLSVAFSIAFSATLGSIVEGRRR